MAWKWPKDIGFVCTLVSDTTEMKHYSFLCSQWCEGKYEQLEVFASWLPLLSHLDKLLGHFVVDLLKKKKMQNIRILELSIFGWKLGVNSCNFYLIGDLHSDSPKSNSKPPR